jgi:hypothetical protein
MSMCPNKSDANKRMQSDFGKLRFPQPLMRGVMRYRNFLENCFDALSRPSKHERKGSSSNFGTSLGRLKFVIRTKPIRNSIPPNYRAYMKKL